MDITIVKTVDGKSYNKYNQEVIKCIGNVFNSCNNLTSGTHTGFCNDCHKLNNRQYYRG